MESASTIPDVIEDEATASAEKRLKRVPLVLHKRNYSWITERIAGVIEANAPHTRGSGLPRKSLRWRDSRHKDFA